MKRESNLKLPKKDRPNGLFLYCNGCKSYYSSDKTVKCKCGNLVYKARIHVSGTKNATIPKVLDAATFMDALQKFYELKSELVNNSYQKVPLAIEENKPIRLIECFAVYMAYLNNEGVPEHKQKKRDPDHIRKVDYAFELYLNALKENGVNTSILKFTDVSDLLVGYVHSYFVKNMDSANKTYNNRMALLRTFTSYIVKEYYPDYKNPFLGVTNLIVTPKVESVREREFTDLLAILTPENGIEKRKQKGRPNLRTTTWYKPWLNHAFRFGLFTGGRSEDIVELKWSDIILDEDKKLHTLRTIDYKIDRANSNKTNMKERLYKFFAITSELEELLVEMGYEKYKNSDKYIIAPDDQLKRSNVARIISGAFTHYYKQLNTGREVTFRNLRKTFITSAMNQFGDASTALTNHKHISISDKHYHDKEVTREAAKGSFSVFRKKSSK